MTLAILSCALFICICPAYADEYLFTVHGVVHEQNGTPIQGANVKIYDMRQIFLGSAMTDSNGSFSLINVSSTTEECSARITYPDDNSYITPSNYYVTFPATGVQFVNITRYKYHDYRPSPSSPLPIPENGLMAALALTLASLAAAFMGKK